MTTGRTLSWSVLRARTALALAPLVMLASSSLGVAVASPAQAAVGDPVPAPVVSTLASPAPDDTPSWTIELPADPEPVVTASDSATVTVTTTHAAECSLTADGTLALGPCGPVEGTTVGFTAPPLEDATWELAVRTVRTTTTTTDLGDGAPASVPVVEPSGLVTRTYVLDSTPPVVSLARTGEPDRTTVRWALTVDEAGSYDLDCVATGATVTTCGPAEVVVELPADGTASVRVTATDAVGGSGAATGTVVLDRFQAVLDGPTGPSKDDRPSWTIAGEPLTGVTCQLTSGDATPVPTGECSDTGYTAGPLPTTTGRDYLLTVTGRDAGGTLGTLTASYRLDSLVDLRLVTEPAPVDDDATPQWTFSGEPVTVVCTLRVDGRVQDGGQCLPTGYTAPQLADSRGAELDLAVEATDALGNVEVFPFGPSVLDSVVDATVVPPTSPGTTVRPGWTVVPGPGEVIVSAVCTLDEVATGDAVPGTCASTGFIADGLVADGAYDLTIEVTDRAGGTALLPAARYVLDRAVDAVLTRPADVVTTLTPSWTITGEALREVSCALRDPDGLLVADGGDGCTTSGYTAPVLTADGTYALTVSVTDLAGNAALLTSSLEVDSRVVATVDAPATPGRDRSPRWVVTGPAGEVTGLGCELLRGGTPVPGGACTVDAGNGSYTAPVLDETPGQDYVLRLTVVDDLGNRLALFPLPYRLDTVLDAAVTAPTSPGNDPTPSWTVSGEPVTVTCALTLADGTPVPGGSCGPGGFTAADLSPTTGTDLLLRLVLTDPAGNPSTQVLSHRVDTVLQLTVGDPPSPSSALQPSWTFTGEDYRSVDCSLTGPRGVVDGGTCTATGYTAATLDPALGREHLLTVTATDLAGNVLIRSSGVHVLDTAAVVEVLGPVGPSSDASPRWSFTGEPYATAACALRTTAGAVVPVGTCADGVAVAEPLPPTTGTTYVLTVSVTDAAGNGASATSAGYLLDTLAELEVTAPATPGLERRPQFAVDTEAGVALTCTLTGPTGVVEGGECTEQGYTAPLLPETTGAGYVLTVDVVDRAGNRATRTSSYRLDTALQLSVVGPTGRGTDPQPSWSLVGEPYATTTCTLTVDGRPVTGGTCGLDGYTAPLLASTTGADVVLTVRATDAAGNVLTVSSATYVLDTVLELEVTGPAGPSPERSPSWTFTGEPFAALTCTLTGPDGLALPGGTCAAGGYTAPALQVDGDHRLVVTATDLAGNRRTVERSYDLDTVALSVAGPTGPSNDRRPSWTFTDEPYTAATCELTGPAGTVVRAACTTTSAFTAPLLPETPGASYVLTVTATDSIGTSRTVSSAPYLLDTRPAAVAVAGPTGAGRTTGVAWTTTVDEPLASATCTLRRDGTAVLPLACPGTTPVELATSGRYDVVVSVVDLAGNRTDSTGPGYVFDAAAPAAPLVEPAVRTTNDPAAAWTIAAEPGTEVTCRLTRDGLLVQDWTACPGGYARTLDADGSWLLEVRAADSVGPGASATATWVLDRVLPAVPVVSGPLGPSQDRAPRWTFTTDPGTTTTCRVLLGAVVVLGPVACSDDGVPVSLLGQPDGSYVLEVTAVDAAGNPAVGRSAGYRLDTTAPEAPGVTGPSGPSPLTSPSSTITGETGTTATCRLQVDGLDVGPPVTCTSPHVPVLDRDGTWTLLVELTDAAGNRSATSAGPAYVLDTLAPAAPTVTPPGATGRDLVPAWAVVAEPGARLQCRLTGPDSAGVFTACAAPITTDLTGRPDGSYVLEVRALDAAGNTGAAGSGSYLLDTTPPPAPVLTAPVSPGRSRTPTVAFTAPAGTTATCRLTSGGTQIAPLTGVSEPCTSPVRLNLATLPDGPYVLSVRVVDAAGNSGPASSATYVLDLSGPPVPQLVDVPASPSSNRRPVVSWLVETGATTSCRLVLASGVRDVPACPSPYDLDLPDLDGSSVLSVWGVDALGNVGEATTLTHVLARTAAAGPVVTAPSSPSPDRAPVWRIAGSGPFECRLTRGTTVLRDWTWCAAGDYRADLFAQLDGTYVLAVRVPGPPNGPATSRYVLDTNGPSAPSVVAQASPSTDRTPTWTVSSPERDVTAECQLLLFGTLLRDWQPCGVSAAGALVTQDLRDLGDGTFSLVVRLVDARGTRGPSTRADYTVNTSAPPAVAIERPASPGSSTTPTWRLIAPAGTQVQCRLVAPDGTVVQDWRSCGTTVTLLLARGDGEYRLAARALSPAGTPGTETSATYQLLTSVQGELRWLAEPTGGTNRTATWTFSLPPDTTGRCTIVEPSGVSTTTPCESPWSPTLQGVEGTYLVELIAVDLAGNESEPITSTYVLRISPAPQPVLTLEPGSPSSSDTPQWRFSTVPRATAECQLLRDGQVVEDWAACTSPYEGRLFARPDGRYELRLRSVAAGLPSDFVASAYVFDRSAPAMPRITAAPLSPGTTTTPAWTFDGPVRSTFECRTGGAGTWAPCSDRVAVGAVPTGRWALSLRAGVPTTQVVEVRLLDADGRVGATSTGTYVLDVRAPDAVRFAREPGTPYGGVRYGDEGDVRWTTQPVQADETTTCQLTGPRPVAPAPCDDGFTVTLTQDGRYVLTVYATDAAGRRGPSTTSTYVYDRKAPEALRWTARPPAAGTTATTSWAFDLVAGDVATCVVLLGAEPVVAEQDCSAGAFVVRLAGRGPGTYVLQVRVADRAGNVGSSVLEGRYALQSTTAAPIRLGGPVVGPPATPQTPVAPRPAGPDVTPVDLPGPTVVPDPPIAQDDVVRGGVVVPQSSGDDTDEALASPGGRPQAFEDLLENLPEALSGTLAISIREPTLPLALLAIVFLFLVAQNQIDRRDPKLAAAPLEAEPELDFTPFVRRPGGAT